MDAKSLTDWLVRIEAKIDAMREHDAKVDVTLTQQAADIQHHIRRTDLLEERVEQVAGDVAPIAKHVERLQGVAWFIGLIVAGAGLGATIKSLLQ